MTDRLFDVDGGLAPEVEAALSATQRLTIRRRAMLDAGKHPLRGDPLRDPPGETCGTCAHIVAETHNGGNRRYFKCYVFGRADVTFGAATDLRKSWPACIRWQAPTSTEGSP